MMPSDILSSKPLLTLGLRIAIKFVLQFPHL